MGQPIIEIKGLTKTFGSGEDSVTALRDIDLQINEGDIFGIIGLSGAGKSTLVRCMNLLERPSAGQVIFDGREITSIKEKELRSVRKSIGMIFQRFNLLMQRTAAENVTFPLELEGAPKKKARERALELLKIVGLEDRADAYPAQLSGGQMQRVAIARAVASNPKVLLCDEATSALDPNTTRAILDLLKDINKTMGVTVVIITHEMKVMEQICNRVAVIDQSRIVEQGEVSQVFTHPKAAITRQLIMPHGTEPEMLKVQELRGNEVIRIVFNGGSAYEPLIASLAIDCGVKVNILGADTRNIDGKAYGSMLIGLPSDPKEAARALEYIKSQDGVTVEEVDD